MNKLAVETLIAKRQQLVYEREKMLEQLNSEIEDIEMAIETLTGDKFMEIPPVERYDDESKDYIKSSLEEM